MSNMTEQSKAQAALTSAMCRSAKGGSGSFLGLNSACHHLYSNKQFQMPTALVGPDLVEGGGETWKSLQHDAQVEREFRGEWEVPGMEGTKYIR